MTRPERDAQLASFCDRWVGYGRPNARIWLVGLEEGGGSTWGEVESRLEQWESRGRPQFSPFRPEPVPADHRWFGERPRLQRYWACMSRLVLAAEEHEVTTEAVRRYQQHELAAPGGGAALLELLPLPSQSTSQWLYSQHSDLPLLSSRAAYRSELMPRRTELLQQLIDDHSPDVVVFVGTTERAAWGAIAGKDLPEGPAQPAKIGDRTAAIMIQHPSAFGVTNAYYEATGTAIAAAGVT